TWRNAVSVKAGALANPSSASAAGSAITGAQWVQYGPEPLRIDAEQNFQGTGPDAGMITELAIDPRGTSDQVVYQSNNDGGIWKTTDSGAHWTPMTDFMPSNSMGAVTLDAGNPSIVYAGTGNTGNVGYFTFSQSTAPNNQTIYASVAGGTACPATGSKPNGCNYNNLFVSTDAGANWNAQVPGAGSAFV